MYMYIAIIAIPPLHARITILFHVLDCSLPFRGRIPPCRDTEVAFST